MSKYGPPRSELIFRLCVGVFIVALVVFALAYRGLQGGPASVEAIASGVIFGGGTIAWCIWKLRKSR